MIYIHGAQKNSTINTGKARRFFIQLRDKRELKDRFFIWVPNCAFISFKNGGVYIKDWFFTKSIELNNKINLYKNTSSPVLFGKGKNEIEAYNNSIDL